MGVDVIGGAPHIEYTREDGVRDVETVFELAEKHDKLIDIHIDETGDPHSRFIEVMAKALLTRYAGSNQYPSAAKTATGCCHFQSYTPKWSYLQSICFSG